MIVVRSRRDSLPWSDSSPGACLLMRKGAGACVTVFDGQPGLVCYGSPPCMSCPA